MQVFISYAHESVELVRQTVEVLTAGGHTVWFDTQLLPGQDWKQELGAEIARSDALVFTMTAESTASEWCQWELATAAKHGKAVIPLLLEPNIKIPEGLSRLQFADFTGGVTPLAVAKLMGALATMQRIPAAKSPEIPASPKGIPSRAWEQSKHWTDVVIASQHTPQNEAEEIVEKFSANLFRGIESVGGRMVLTNQRLLFEAHKINAQTQPESIPLLEIDSVEPCNTLGIVPNGLKVHCQSGRKYQFVVWDRKRIISMIKEGQDHLRNRR